MVLCEMPVLDIQPKTKQGIEDNFPEILERPFLLLQKFESNFLSNK